MRRVAAAGDFATLLHRGDAEAGAVVLVHRYRDLADRALSRAVGPAGEAVWQVAARGESVGAWLERQRRFDPDLWVIELDSPDLARFIDETII